MVTKTLDNDWIIVVLCFGGGWLLLLLGWGLLFYSAGWDLLYSCQVYRIWIPLFATISSRYIIVIILTTSRCGRISPDRSLRNLWMVMLRQTIWARSEIDLIEIERDVGPLSSSRLLLGDIVVLGLVVGTYHRDQMAWLVARSGAALRLHVLGMAEVVAIVRWIRWIILMSHRYILCVVHHESIISLPHAFVS